MITFPHNKYTENSNTFGVNFQAVLEDDSTIACVISTEALQDVNPECRDDDVINQFLENRSTFESIAEKKILDDNIVDGKVYISKKDL